MQMYHSSQEWKTVNLIRALEEVSDPRVDRAKYHGLVDILVIAL